MESETGPGEGGITPGSWILVVSPGLHGGGALGPGSPVGAAEAMQAPGGVPGEEATLYWVEAVEEGAALEEGELSGTGQDVQLLVLDVMEEVEVVVYEEQEQVSSEEQAQELARPGTPSDRPALEALAALQLELEPVNKQAQRAHARLRHKTCQRRTFYLEHRSAIIQGIRGFWVEVVSLGVVLVIFFFFFFVTCAIAGAVYRWESSGTKLFFLFCMMGIHYHRAYLFLILSVMSFLFWLAQIGT